MAIISIDTVNATVLCFGVSMLQMTLFAPQPCQAQLEVHHTLQAVKSSYDSGNNLFCVRLAKELIEKEPGNATAYYYLGCAFMRLGYIDSARKVFVQCESLGRGKEVGKLAARALAELSPLGTLEEKNSSAVKQPVGISVEKERLLAEQDKEIKEAEKRFGERIDRLQKEQFGDQFKNASQREFDQLSKEQAAIMDRYQRRINSLMRRETNTGLGQARSR